MRISFSAIKLFFGQLVTNFFGFVHASLNFNVCVHCFDNCPTLTFVFIVLTSFQHCKFWLQQSSVTGTVAARIWFVHPSVQKEPRTNSFLKGQKPNRALTSSQTRWFEVFSVTSTLHAVCWFLCFVSTVNYDHCSKVVITSKRCLNRCFSYVYKIIST